MTPVVGVDPSLTSTGLVGLGMEGEPRTHRLRTKAGSCIEGRFVWIRDQVLEFILEVRPRLVAIEGPAQNKKHGHAATDGLSAVLRVALFEAEVPFVEVPPTVLKKFATGKGNAQKDVVMREVFKRWGFESNCNDVVDAYVLARVAEAVLSGEAATKPMGEAVSKLAVVERQRRAA